MKLLRASLLNSLAVATKIGSSLLLSKVLAVILGPTGFGVIGQFQNLVTLVNTCAGGGLTVGVTKYTAQDVGDTGRLNTVWITASIFTLCWTGATAAVILIFRVDLARWTLADAGLTYVLDWLAISLIFGAANGLMLAILNGKKAVGAYVLASILGGVASAALAVGLVVSFGLSGALVALAIGQGVACFFTFMVFRKHVPLGWIFRPRLFDNPTARALSGFALMSATSAIVVPLSQIQIRNHIGSALGWHEAGLWQAMLRISETHLMLLTTTLSVYFLPRFSEIASGSALRREMWRGCIFVLPVVVTTSTIIYSSRVHLISLFLSKDFLSLVEILPIQLIGDILKATSWLFAITMLSHARVRTFVVTEVLINALFCILANILSDSYGLRGAAAAYALTYAVYLVVTAALFRHLSHSIPSPRSGNTL